MMTEHNPSFYLKDPSTRGANWKLLYYHPNGSAGRPAIKIDILLPGSAEIPFFDPDWINYSHNRGFPAAPLLLVLLHKTLGWSRRFNSPDYHQYKKHWRDAGDVAKLLELSSQMGVTIVDDILPDTFIDNASTWVSEFMAQYPRTEIRSHWRKIGFRKSARGTMILATR